MKATRIVNTAKLGMLLLALSSFFLTLSCSCQRAKTTLAHTEGTAATAQASGKTPANDVYTRYFDLAQEAKKKGDMAAMEENLTLALQNGPGTEYAWRSLAWSQMNQGKWKLALENSYENIRRNGESSWSLKQLFAAAVEAGDLKLARKTVKRMDKLPAARRNTDTTNEPLDLERLTKPTVLDVTWKVKVADCDVQDGTIYIQPPCSDHLWQTCETTVEGVKDWTLTKDGRWDVLTIRPGDVKEFRIKSRIVHKPCVLGRKKLESVTATEAPADLKKYLGNFINDKSYDIQNPRLQALAKELKGKTMAETVQNILDWEAKNMRYEFGYSDELDEILRTHRGVCHHYSNLTVALCRAAGVPALVAHGIRLPDRGTFKDQAPSHGWVEVYIGGLGWVPADPLGANTLRSFRAAGYVIVDTTSHTPTDDHFHMKLSNGRHLEAIQGFPASGTATIMEK